MLHMIARERRNEEVRVIVAVLIPHINLLARLLRRSLKILWQ